MTFVDSAWCVCIFLYHSDDVKIDCAGRTEEPALCGCHHRRPVADLGLPAVVPYWIQCFSKSQERFTHVRSALHNEIQPQQICSVFYMPSWKPRQPILTWYFMCHNMHALLQYMAMPTLPCWEKCCIWGLVDVYLHTPTGVGHSYRKQPVSQTH